MGLASVQKKLVCQQTSGIFSAVRKHNGLMGWHHNSNYPYSYRSGTTWCHAKLNFFLIMRHLVGPLCLGSTPTQSPGRHQNLKRHQLTTVRYLYYYFTFLGMLLYYTETTLHSFIKYGWIEKDNIFLQWQAVEKVEKARLKKYPNRATNK